LSSEFKIISSEVSILNQSITQKSKDESSKELEFTSKRFAINGFHQIANFSSSV
jgi:hypothetical protein